VFTLSPEPAGQFQSNFGTNHPLVKRIKDCSKDGPGSFPRRDI
jgi:hypothetical protein